MRKTQEAAKSRSEQDREQPVLRAHVSLSCLGPLFQQEARTTQWGQHVGFGAGRVGSGPGLAT